jgi:hypothetical protein
MRTEILLTFPLLACSLVFGHTLVDSLAPTYESKSAAETDHEWLVSVSKYDGKRAQILGEVDHQDARGLTAPTVRRCANLKYRSGIKMRSSGFLFTGACSRSPVRRTSGIRAICISRKTQRSKSTFSVSARRINSATKISFRSSKQKSGTPRTGRGFSNKRERAT